MAVGGKKPFYPLFSFKTELVTFEWKPRGYKERARTVAKDHTSSFLHNFPRCCELQQDTTVCSRPCGGAVGGSARRRGVSKEFIEYGTPLAIFGFHLAFCEYSILKTWAFLSLNKG